MMDVMGFSAAAALIEEKIDNVAVFVTVVWRFWVTPKISVSSVYDIR